MSPDEVIRIFAAAGAFFGFGVIVGFCLAVLLMSLGVLKCA